MADGNGVSFSNKEVVVNLFRGAVLAGGFVLTILGWLLVDKVSSFSKQFDVVAQQREQMWKTMADLAEKQGAAASVMTRLETTLTDYIRNQDAMIVRMGSTQQDHEIRLRGLENIKQR